MPRRGVQLWLYYSFFDLNARWGWVFNATPQLIYSQERDRYPFYRRLGGPQCNPGRKQKKLT
jgi:hypothetical protein